MSARVTSSDVEAIIEVDSTISLTPFINAAHLMVEQNLSAAGLAEEVLTEVERWLSAHFYAIRDPRYTSESAGVSASYQRSSGSGLASTDYGQQAIAFDSSGILGRIAKGNRVKASIKTIGVPPDGSAS